MSLEEKLRELEELRRRSLEGGGPEKIKRQRERGKLLARERLDLLLDPGSFQELDWLVTTRGAPLGEVPRIPGDGVVAGFGRINGRPVFVFSQDFTVAGGSIGEMHAEKIVRTIKYALKSGVPVIGIWDSGGARIQEGVAALHGVGRIFNAIIQASGVIPQISLVLGSSAGGAAYAPALMDFTIVVDKITYMFVTGPDVVREVTGEEVTFEQLGGARVHSQLSGVAHFRAANEEEAFRITRRLLSYLPDNNEAPLPIIDTGDPVDRRDPDLDSMVPDDPHKPYDMKQVLERIFDHGSLLEVQPEWGTSIITAFARLGGIPVCVVASQPLVLSGAIDINASCKAARFVRFCDAFNLPVITFVDVPGYMPGLDQEHGGIIRHGAKMLYAYAEATVPKLTVVVRKAYGGAYISMGSKSLGADIVYAWPTAEIAVLGAEAAVRILYRKRLRAAENPEEERKRLIDEYRRTFLNPFRAAELGLVDDVVKPSETRYKLYTALEVLLKKREPRLPKKHGNIPL
ncbi:acyl-CoA carboxylase subunit beta [Hyperthermus butylicus]|uniref:Propionyl-CoA carboxylase beta chain n=1 Tax=Hyperthermus butylicus (strain DSM 5456 / JCM 9403 / PLM1-5) TaxID=415426 RepID=A2BLY1_HYPBU|nr:acyl-CoA carboxylase subunit beta [Hyperthermus butylicus]ABM80992.1 Propionyl-CoA carboxylase beta chain [Hyperthermus butylicus DSM 5456]